MNCMPRPPPGVVCTWGGKGICAQLCPRDEMENCTVSDADVPSYNIAKPLGFPPHPSLPLSLGKVKGFG